MDNALLVCLCICIFIIMSIFGASNFVGAINEQLEILTPNMRKIRLPRKLVRFVPQWCRTGCLNPEGAIYKSEVYVLTVILAIINYIYGLLSLVVAIVVFITCSEYLMCLLL